MTPVRLTCRCARRAAADVQGAGARGASPHSPLTRPKTHSKPCSMRALQITYNHTSCLEQPSYVSMIGHARINIEVNISHAWLEMADSFRTHRVSAARAGWSDSCGGWARTCMSSATPTSTTMAYQQHTLSSVGSRSDWFDCDLTYVGASARMHGL